MNTVEEAARRWQCLVVPAAISADDFAAAAELLAANVPQETVRALYPLDFAALLNYVANQLNAFGIAPVESNFTWIRLYSQRQELLRNADIAQHQLNLDREPTVALVRSRLWERIEVAAVEAGYDPYDRRRASHCLFTACCIMATPVEPIADSQAFFIAVADLLLPHLREVSA